MLGSGDRIGEESKDTIPTQGIYNVKEELTCYQYLVGSGKICQPKGSQHIWKKETVLW